MRYLRADPWPLRLSLMLSLFHHCIDVENKLSQNYWFCSQAIFFQFWLSLIKIYFSRKFIKWGIVETISSWTACLFLFLMNICHRMPCLEIQFWTEFNTHAHNMTALFEEKTCYWEMSPAFIVTKKIILRPPLFKWHFSIFSLLPNFILSGKSTYVSQVCVCIKKTFYDHNVHIHNQSRKNIPFSPSQRFCSCMQITFPTTVLCQWVDESPN